MMSQQIATIYRMDARAGRHQAGKSRNSGEEISIQGVATVVAGLAIHTLIGP